MQGYEYSKACFELPLGWATTWHTQFLRTLNFDFETLIDFEPKWQQCVYTVCTYNPFLCVASFSDIGKGIFFGVDFRHLFPYQFSLLKMKNIWPYLSKIWFSYNLVLPFFHPPFFYTLYPLSSIEKVYATLCCFGALTTLLLPSIWVEKWYFFCSFA